jgi:outer membrane protein assembly factor BamD
LRWLLAICLFIGGPVHAKKNRARLTVAEQYELGLKYMKRGMYIKAIEQFNRVRNYHRDDPHALKAELAIGDVYYKKAEWDQARLAYEDFSRMHPRHPDLDYVVYRIGMSMYEKAPKASGRDQTWTRHAVRSWSGFASRFPDSDYRDDVDERLTECRERLATKELWIARFYKRRSAWPAVQQRAEGVLSRYPGSEAAVDSLALIAVAHAWQGDTDSARIAVRRLAEKDERASKRIAKQVEKIIPKAAEPGRR